MARTLIGLAVLLASLTAYADDAAEAPEVVDAGVEVQPLDAGAAGLVDAVATPAPTSASTPPVATAPLTARQRRAGSVGVGFIGSASVMRAAATVVFDPTTGQPSTSEVRAVVPMLGLRWWTKNPVVGFEAGFGLMYSEGKVEQTNPNSVMVTDQPSTLEWVGHLGLPLAVVSGEHLIVVVSPEFRVGNSNRTVPSAKPDPNYAWTIDAGLRAGVEIFFSFIGLDRLSLEISARIGVTHEIRTLTSQGALGQNSSNTTTTTRFSTSLMGDPWAILSSAFALRYYF